MTYSVPEKVRKTPFKHQKRHEKLSQTAVYQPFNLFCHLNTKKILQNKRCSGYLLRSVSMVIFCASMTSCLA